MNSILMFLWMLSALKWAENNVLDFKKEAEIPLLSSSDYFSTSSMNLKNNLAPEATTSHKKDHFPIDISNLQGDSEYGFWARPIVSQDSSINLSNETPKRGPWKYLETFSKPVTNLLTTFLNDKRFQAYQELAGKIAPKTEDKALSFFAAKIELLGSRLSAHDQSMFLDEKMSCGIQDFGKLFKDGLKLLQADTLLFKERVWILGLIACLEPQDSKVKDSMSYYLINTFDT